MDRFNHFLNLKRIFLSEFKELIKLNSKKLMETNTNIEEVVKKKRGRKPKNSSIEENIILEKKKRGRKKKYEIENFDKIINRNEINNFDHEGRQCRITLAMPEFKPYVKIVEERLLNRFWYMNQPFLTFYNLGVNNLVWKPGDFIVHVSGYSLKDRIQLLSDLNYFSGGAIAKFRYENSTVIFSPLEKLNFAKILIKDVEGNILNQSVFDFLSHKLNYYIGVPKNPERILFEAYDEYDNLISKRLFGR